MSRPPAEESCLIGVETMSALPTHTSRGGDSFAFYVTSATIR
jgi:hypothetical protein